MGREKGVTSLLPCANMWIQNTNNLVGNAAREKEIIIITTSEGRGGGIRCRKCVEEGTAEITRWHDGNLCFGSDRKPASKVKGEVGGFGVERVWKKKAAEITGWHDGDLCFGSDRKPVSKAKGGCDVPGCIAGAYCSHLVGKYLFADEIHFSVWTLGPTRMADRSRQEKRQTHTSLAQRNTMACRVSVAPKCVTTANDWCCQLPATDVLLAINSLRWLVACKWVDPSSEPVFTMAGRGAVRNKLALAK